MTQVYTCCGGLQLQLLRISKTLASPPSTDTVPNLLLTQHLLRGFAAEAVEDFKNAGFHATPDNKRIRIHALEYAFYRKESGALRFIYKTLKTDHTRATRHTHTAICAKHTHTFMLSNLYVNTKLFGERLAYAHTHLAHSNMRRIRAHSRHACTEDADVC